MSEYRLKTGKIGEAAVSLGMKIIFVPARFLIIPKSWRRLWTSRVRTPPTLKVPRTFMTLRKNAFPLPKGGR